MGCLYYIPGRRFASGRVPDTVKSETVPGGAAGVETLEALGLGHLTGARLTYRVVRNSGPDGGNGLIIGIGVPANETGFFRDEQEWIATNGGALYVGWKASSRPRPDTFARERAPRPSVTVTLGDGNPWGFVESAALPQRAVFNSAGEAAWAPRDCDAAHYEACAWIADYARGGEGRPYFDILDRVAVCLGARYHVSVLEVVALGLFTTDLLEPVVYACLGVDISDDEKKSEDSAA